MINQTRVPRFLRGFTPAVLWLLVILFLSTYGVQLNLPESVWDLFGWDKLAHAVIYGILALLLVWGFRERKAVTTSVLALAFLLATAYGVLMEIVQFSFFPKRSFEILDIIANIIGISASIFVYYFYIIKKPR